MQDDAWCEIDDLPLSQCEHGLSQKRKNIARTTVLEISPRNQAHFPGCPHKDDQDYSQWGILDTLNAWERLGNGEHLRATGGGRPDRIATSRCRDCVEHGGPWV